MFHIVFGKSVPDISHNATANMGYADVRFLRPVYPGDTLMAESEVIGLREVSSGDAGVVYVRTRGTNQKGQEVLSFVRWVMVPKRDRDQANGRQRAAAPRRVAPAGCPADSESAAVPGLAWLCSTRLGDYRRASGSITARDDDRESDPSRRLAVPQHCAGPLRRHAAQTASRRSVVYAGT